MSLMKQLSRSSALWECVFVVVTLIAVACPNAFAANGEQTSNPSHKASAASGRMNLYVAPAGNDHDDGSIDHPWATIQHAANNVYPGATVHVASGLYQGTIKSTVSGTAAAPITFRSEKKWGAVLRNGSSTANAVWANSGDHVRIVGFDI